MTAELEYLRHTAPSIIQNFEQLLHQSSSANQIQNSHYEEEDATSSVSNSSISPTLEQLLLNYRSLSDDIKKQLMATAISTDNEMLLKCLLELQADNPSKPMELAKLMKELLTHAEKHKVRELKYEENAAKRQNAYHNWIAHVGPILGMFPETCEVLKEDEIIPYLDPSCHGNQALFLFISAKVDAYFRALIRRHKGFGDRALELIKTQCANVTNVDKHHFHKAFTSLAILHEESAAHFLQRFTIGRQQA
jgi:hypothetical protein